MKTETNKVTEQKAGQAGKQGWMARLVEKLDASMKAKAEIKSQSSCCCADDGKGGGKCC